MAGKFFFIDLFHGSKVLPPPLQGGYLELNHYATLGITY